MIAYIDPGILAAIYQVAYAGLAALFAAYILRPWNLVKNLFGKKSDKKKSDKK